MTIILKVGYRSGAGNLHWQNVKVPNVRQDGDELSVNDLGWTLRVGRLESQNSTTALIFSFHSARQGDKEGVLLHTITYRADYAIQGQEEPIPVDFKALGIEASGWLVLTF